MDAELALPAPDLEDPREEDDDSAAAWWRFSTRCSDERCVAGTAGALPIFWLPPVPFSIDTAADSFMMSATCDLGLLLSDLDGLNVLTLPISWSGRIAAATDGLFICSDGAEGLRSPFSSLIGLPKG